MNRGWDEKTKRSGPKGERNSTEKNKPLKHLFLTYLKWYQGTHSCQSYYLLLLLFGPTCCLNKWQNHRKCVACMRVCVCNIIHYTAGWGESLKRTPWCRRAEKLSRHQALTWSVLQSLPVSTAVLERLARTHPEKKTVRGCCNDGIHPLLPCSRTFFIVWSFFIMVKFTLWIKFSPQLLCCLLLKGYVAKMRDVSRERARPNSFNWEVCNLKPWQLTK